VFRALRDDRPSTGPLGRSEKAALVSGSSSALLGRRRRVSACWAPVPGLLTLIGWLLLAAAGTGWVAAGSGDVMAWTGCVAA
jgi:hypothetical protein